MIDCSKKTIDQSAFSRQFLKSLSEFLEISCLLSSTRFFSKFLSGFRQRYSCQTSLLRMIEDWKSELDNGNIIGTVAIDLSKAFDSLPHGLLIAKLHAYGVDLSSCRSLASYLPNRYQRVKIKDIKSDWLIMDRGVPQGSILGPLLFNMFIKTCFSSTMISIYTIRQMIITFPMLKKCFANQNYFGKGD